MARWQLLGALAGITLLAGACAEEGLKTRLARLDVTAVTEGYSYASHDDATRTIHVGEVPVYSSRVAAFELKNPTSSDLIIESIAELDASGRKWIQRAMDACAIEDCDADCGLCYATREGKLPLELKAGGTTVFEVEYAPLAVGNEDYVHIGIKSKASNADADGYLDVTVKGVGGDPLGEPDIAVAYGTYEGPVPADCTAGVCTASAPLDFGNIGFGSEGTVRLRILNRAHCLPFPNVEECKSCALVLEKDPTAQNIGIGFHPDTNQAGLFTFEASTATPAEILQDDPQCDQNGHDADGQLVLPLKFAAPTSEAEHTATIVIESNDPDEPVIHIPVRAYARNAPVAVAKLDTNLSDPDSLRPLERAYFDGSESYDPNGLPITAYSWEVVEAPEGVNPDDYAFQGQGTDAFSFWVPLAGKYVIRLMVTNGEGITSGDTAESRVAIDVVPGSRLHVQLVWDHPTNDQDLHLTNAGVDDRVCNGLYDCYFSNCKPETWSSYGNPVWDDTAAPRTGPNPRLDKDDTNGLGPENINIDEPIPGTYRVYVHYWSDGGDDNVPTQNTVRIYLNGVERAEYRRTLAQDDDLWAVADIVWLPDNTGYVTPYPGPDSAQVGKVVQMTDCSHPGFAFP